MIRLGLIGCGEHAIRDHLDHMSKGRMILTGVFDTNFQAMHNAAKSHGGKVVNICMTEEALLSSPDVDAILIASPDKYHPEQLLRTVLAGKHVLVEKPLAVSSLGMDIVLIALDIAKSSGILVTSCHPRRFDPPYVKLQEMLPYIIKQLGPVQELLLDFSYHAPSSSWKHDRSLLLDHFGHEIDYLNFLLGTDDFTAYRLYDSYDKYAVAGCRKDGITFHFTGTRMLDADIFPEEIMIRFAHGTCRVHTKIGRIVLEYHEDLTHDTHSFPMTNYDVRFENMMLNFVESIEKKAENYLTHTDLRVNNVTAVSLFEDGVTHWAK